MPKRFLFSSESVTEGHPDKIADQISDAVLDAIIAQDKEAHVACETLVTTGLAMVAGEITTSCYVHIPDIVRETIQAIGYNDPALGIDYKTCAVVASIDRQSPDITRGVSGLGKKKKELGAGDQGMMFGYACDHTSDFMPLPISLAHGLTRRLAEARKKKLLDFLGPDGKSQVSIEFEDDKPVRMSAIIVSSQHAAHADNKTIHEGIMEEVIKKVVPAKLMDKNTAVHINPTGRFVIGGPQGDCGLTGRKIIVDTYGGWARHGGGAFSGKDPTKVDRSAAYMARYVAKNVVAAGLAKRCEVQLAY
ncbi:MAG: methionine adenosyltransferase, partial [Myxococcales bacterium]